MEKLRFVQVVNGNRDHYDALLPLWRNFIRELDANRGNCTTEESIVRSLTRRIAIQGTRGDMHFEIAYLNDTAIGLSNFAIDLGTVYGLLERGGGVFLGFYIAPEYRRKGYARQMLEHCEAVLIYDGAKFLYACPEPNIGEPFWVAVGFVNSGKIDPDDKLPIYIKEVPVIKELPLAAAEEKSRICRTILEGLPDWFGIPEAIDEYVKSVGALPFWAAYQGDCPIGFVALSHHNPYTAEIDVMGIAADYHHKGIGRRLIATVEGYCRGCGKSMLLVKTLDSAHPDRYYAQTRAFYLAMGFIPLQVLPGYWGEHNPCLLLGKCLRHGCLEYPL